MNYPDLIDEGFPSPDEREPAELRGDIADELSDHLTCIFDEERSQKEIDESAAHSRALERFGNPKRLAYRLWWEAMKEKIMKDRIILIAMILMAIGTIAVAGLTWVSFQKSQEVNRAMVQALEKIAANRPAEPAPSTPAQSSVAFHVLKGSAEGAPVNHARIDLASVDAEGKSEMLSTGEYTDDQGWLRKIIPPGKYRYWTYKYATPNVLLSQSQTGLVIPAGDQRVQPIILPTFSAIEYVPKLDAVQKDPDLEVLFGFEMKFAPLDGWQAEGDFICDRNGNLFDFKRGPSIDSSVLRLPKSLQSHSFGVYLANEGGNNFYTETPAKEPNLGLPSLDFDLMLTEFYALPGSLIEFPHQDATVTTPRYLKFAPNNRILIGAFHLENESNRFWNIRLPGKAVECIDRISDLVKGITPDAEPPAKTDSLVTPDTDPNAPGLSRQERIRRQEILNSKRMQIAKERQAKSKESGTSNPLTEEAVTTPTLTQTSP